MTESDPPPRISENPLRPGGTGRGRPGAMTMAMQAVQSRESGPKVLRIGLIQGGKIVEERIIRKRETVTVGSSEKNHFVVAAPGLSSRFELFQLVGNDYILNFTEDMRGRVGLAGGVSEFSELRSGGGARKAQGYYQVKLNDNSRGKVVIGETTLLFQFVVPPPVQPRPQLPAAVVGGFIAGIDWLFTAFIMFSFMTHFGFIIYLENADWPVEPTIATVPDRVADLIFNEPPPPPHEETPQAPSEDSDEAEEETAQEETHESHASNEPQDQATSDANARLAAEDALSAVQMTLGAIGEEGALQDLLRNGAAIGNAGDLLETARGVGQANGDIGGLRERGGGGTLGGTEGLGALEARTGRAGNAQTEGEQVEERVIHGRVRTEGAPEDEGGSGVFDSANVVRQIRLRLRRIQSCYERELRNNPTLSGRVAVRFTIEVTGTVSNASASENTTGSPVVADCVVGAIRSIRFNPTPEGGSVAFSYPFVFAPQN
jgi:TonB family protein